MQELPKALKIKISVCIVWAVLTALFSGAIADGAYSSGFSFGAFLGFLVALNLPLLIYWLGFWIWGDGYIFKIIVRLYRILRIKKVAALVLALLGMGIVINIMQTLGNVLGLATMGRSDGVQSALNAIGTTFVGILGCWTAIKIYKRIINNSAEFSANVEKK